MIKEASISEMTKKKIPKGQRVLVARKRGNDELAPSEELFHDFTKRKKTLEEELLPGSTEAHNRAFLDCGYERRFRDQVKGNPDALTKLEKISQKAREEDLYLICYEGPSKACHRRILLRIAEEMFGAHILVEGIEPK